MKIKYYINLAKKKNNLTSDAQLARLIGIKTSSLSNILSKKTKTPKSWVYMKILELAKIQQSEKDLAIIDYMLAVTKKSEYMQNYFSEMKKQNSFYLENLNR